MFQVPTCTNSAFFVWVDYFRFGSYDSSDAKFRVRRDLGRTVPGDLDVLKNNSSRSPARCEEFSLASVGLWLNMPCYELSHVEAGMKSLALAIALLSVAIVSGHGDHSGQVQQESGKQVGEASRKFEKIDYPGAKSIIPSAINGRGDIAGRYDDADSKTHGFLLRDGKFITIDVPGEAFTVVRGMNGSGELVGASGPGYTIHAFRFADGQFTPIKYPGAVATFAIVCQFIVVRYGMYLSTFSLVLYRR